MHKTQKGGEIPFHPALGNYPHVPGHRGVRTSIDAAAKIAPISESIEQKVLYALRYLFFQGATSYKMSNHLQIKHNKVQPAFSRLKAKGMIVDSGETEKNTDGNKAVIWMAN